MSAAAPLPFRLAYNHNLAEDAEDAEDELPFLGPDRPTLDRHATVALRSTWRGEERVRAVLLRGYDGGGGGLTLTASLRKPRSRRKRGVLAAGGREGGLLAGDGLPSLPPFLEQTSHGRFCNADQFGLPLSLSPTPPSPSPAQFVLRYGGSKPNDPAHPPAMKCGAAGE